MASSDLVCTGVPRAAGLLGCIKATTSGGAAGLTWRRAPLVGPGSLLMAPALGWELLTGPGGVGLPRALLL